MDTGQPRRASPGCFWVGCLIVMAVVVVAAAVSMSLDAYSSGGSEKAGRSYDEQHRQILDAFDAVPLPPGTVREGRGMSRDLRDPYDRESAVSGYKRQRNPLGGFWDIICFDTCPQRWRPGQGLFIIRSLQAPGTADTSACSFFEAALQKFAGEVNPAPFDPEDRGGTLCAFDGIFRGVRLSIAVLRGGEEEGAFITLYGGTRGWICHRPVVTPTTGPDCLPRRS